MKRYKPENMMPDEDTEVLAYYGKEIGYVVARQSGGEWMEAWGETFINQPEYWIDLDDIKKSSESMKLYIKENICGWFRGLE